MKAVLFLGNYAVIFIVFIIVAYGFLENKNVFQIFISGVKEGEKIFLELIPTWLGLFFAIGMLKSSGLIEFITNTMCKVFKFAIDYKEIFPLVLLRPISGSSSTAMGIEILKNVGVDSKLGLITSCVMGSTETTLYVVALYTSKISKKNVKPVIIIGLIGDFLCILFSTVFMNNIINT